MLPIPHTSVRALTVPQAAERLGVSPRTIWTWISEGRLDAFKLSARTTRIREDALDRFVSECERRG